MARFLIEITHIDEHDGCIRALHALEQSGSHFITHADHGCGDGVHAGWLIAELDSRAEAEQIVPTAFRPDARIVELQNFTREEIIAMLEKLES